MEHAVAAEFNCTIVTPTRQILDDDILYASIPAWDGQIGFMPGGSPALIKLGHGSLRLDFPEGGSRWYLIEGGFAEYHDNHLSILSEGATPAERISLREAEAELAEAGARVTGSDEDRDTVERDQQRALAKVSLAKAHAARGGAI